MIFSPEGIKIYCCLDATDMRKSIDTLCILVQEALELEPGSGHLFLFCNRSRNKLKALYYEDHCFSVWYRRLESGKFIFPKDAQGHIEMTREHFDWLLASHRYTQMNPDEPIFYDTFASKMLKRSGVCYTVHYESRRQSFAERYRTAKNAALRSS